MDKYKVRNKGGSLILVMIISSILTSVLLSFNLYIIGNSKNFSIKYDRKKINDEILEKVDVKYD